MKRNLDLPLKDLDGTPYKDKATLKTVLFAAVTTPLEEDQKLNVDEKLKLFGLAQEVYKGGVVDLTAEQITLIKARVAKIFPVLVMGTTFALLEQDAAPAKK